MAPELNKFPHQSNWCGNKLPLYKLIKIDPYTVKTLMDLKLITQAKAMNIIKNVKERRFNLHYEDYPITRSKAKHSLRRAALTPAQEKLYGKGFETVANYNESLKENLIKDLVPEKTSAEVTQCIVKHAEVFLNPFKPSFTDRDYLAEFNETKDELKLMEAINACLHISVVLKRLGDKEISPVAADYLKRFTGHNGWAPKTTYRPLKSLSENPFPLLWAFRRGLEYTQKFVSRFGWLIKTYEDLYPDQSLYQTKLLKEFGSGISFDASARRGIIPDPGLTLSL